MKIKNGIKILMISIGLLLLMSSIALGKDPETVYVSTQEELLQALDNPKEVIQLKNDIDLDLPANAYHVYDISQSVLDLGGYTLKLAHMSIIFEGNNFKIQNGTMEGKQTPYPLFIGENPTDGVIIENIKLIGGINVYESSNVVLRNVEAQAAKYYAIWCDTNGQVTVESGNYSTSSQSTAVVGLTTSGSSLKITGGNFQAGEKLLVLANGDKYGVPEISGGTFDVTVEEKYLTEGSELIAKEDGSYFICNHAKTIRKDEKEATCSEEGYTGDKYCEVCQKLLETGNKIDATGHTLSDWLSDETMHWKICTKEACGIIIPESKKEHTYTGQETKCNVCSYEKPEDKKEWVDDKTDIQLETKVEGVLPSKTILQINEVKESSEYEQIKALLPEVSDIRIYDISLLFENNKIQPNGKVTIKIPLSEQEVQSDLTMYRIEEDGKKTELPSTMITTNGKSYLQFETDHFSYYVIASKTKQTPNEGTGSDDPVIEDEGNADKNEEQTEGVKDETPGTNAIDAIYYIVPAMIVSGMGIIILKRKLRKS